MKRLITIALAALLAGLILPSKGICEELSSRALKYFEGSWEAGVANEGELDVNSRFRKIGKSAYSGTGKMTADGKSLLQIGGWSKAGVSGGVGWARYYKLGSEPNTMVIYVYSTNADHAVIKATVKPHGDYFELVGEETGVTADRELTASKFSLVVKDEDHFSITSTSRTVDGVAKNDEVLEFARKKQ